MRYYFHLESETNVHIDHWGKDFDWPQDAIDYADALARELSRDDRWLGWSVRVIDAHNTEVSCVAVLDPVVPK